MNSSEEEKVVNLNIVKEQPEKKVNLTDLVGRLKKEQKKEKIDNMILTIIVVTIVAAIAFVIY
tara:strand:+ start:265 stop:453 length:189 start_codon:yes stop_codon:yes gene_type:complete